MQEVQVTGCFCSIVLASIITIMMVLLVFASAKAIQKTTTSKFEVLQVLSSRLVSPFNFSAAAGLTASPVFLYSSSAVYVHCNIKIKIFTNTNFANTYSHVSTVLGPPKFYRKL